MEDVRVCRSCGHIDAAERRGRCPACDLFSELVIVPRPEAERLARRQRRRRWRQRLWRLGVLGGVGAGVTLWALGVLFDLGPNPPSATTNLSTSSAPHIWAQARRTTHNNGFTPDAVAWPHRVLWTYRAAKPLPAAPAVVDHHVYLTTSDGRILALERHTGHLLWAHQSGGSPGSTPAVAGDSVLVAMRPGRVVSLNRHTGELRWETDLKHPILAPPVVARGTVYLGAADQQLYALDAATGRQRWRFATGGWTAAAVAYTQDRVIVTSQHSRLHIVSADTGRQRFVYETGLGRHVVGGATIQGEGAFFGSLGGRIWAIDWRATTYPLERGMWFWKTNLYVWGMISTPPVQKGSRWSRAVGGDIVHTPALAHNTLYVTTTRGKVIALDTAHGRERWTVDLHVDITAAPTVAGETVLIGTQAGVVFGLHAHTGEIMWDLKTAGKITGSPIVAGTTLYVVSHDGTLYAVASAR